MLTFFLIFLNFSQFYLQYVIWSITFAVNRITIVHIYEHRTNRQSQFIRQFSHSSRLPPLTPPVSKKRTGNKIPDNKPN